MCTMPMSFSVKLSAFSELGTTGRCPGDIACSEFIHHHLWKCFIFGFLWALNVCSATSGEFQILCVFFRVHYLRGRKLPAGVSNLKSWGWRSRGSFAKRVLRGSTWGTAKFLMRWICLTVGKEMVLSPPTGRKAVGSCFRGLQYISFKGNWGEGHGRPAQTWPTRTPGMKGDRMSDRKVWATKRNN